MAEEPKENLEAQETEAVAEEKYAKAGKKSKKHVEEVKAEAERQARKAEAAAAPEKVSGPKPVTRSRLERRGKNYREAYAKVEKGKAYSLKEAVELAIATSPVKFDATLEMHFRLGVDPRQADQNIRSTVTLPAGTGKDIRVAVFAPLDVCKAAKAAGADIAEDEEFTKRLEKEQLDFDVLISTPQYMPKLGKFARLLGPKGLMPNPKAGTVSMDIASAIKEIKNGKLEYRTDKEGNICLPIAKVSFDAEKIVKNIETVVALILKIKPQSVKGTYVQNCVISSTMGPSIKIAVESK